MCACAHTRTWEKFSSLIASSQHYQALDPEKCVIGASPNQGVAHDDDTDPRILRDLLTMRWHALLQALCAMVTEEQRVEPASVAASANIHSAIAVIDAVLAEPEGRAP
jgi:hypothetical protein